MMREIAIAGVFVHPLLIAAIIAFPLAEAIAWLLGRADLYHFVWHRGLFDIAMTAILWCGIASIMAGTSPFSLLQWPL
ncbi:DUF1656 domain-containing protein [uncultured Sphingomonas sp.]|uniref:DUF1656 domain-containing protein n=1 Tax=uncultured Sphingomonas sp. TaxID=158754 RepID=UPI002616DFCB|nr:DUF1656 domain-containing protein [uncultured Sphingomonas sp.]